MPRTAPKKAGPGRPKGSRNKLTMDIKAMIVGALDKAGGEKYLLQQAKENPNAFLTLVGKVLPMQIAGDSENPIEIHTVKRVILKTDARKRDT